MLSATLQQGIQFRKYQDKIMHRRLDKKKEGLTNMLSQENATAISQTNHVLDQTAISQSRLQELQQLQTTFNSLLEQLHSAERQLESDTKKYISGSSNNTNVKVTTIINNPESYYFGDYNAIDTNNPASAPIMTAQPGGATYTYDSCQAASLNNNSQAFALRNVDPISGKAECALLLNSTDNIRKYGQASRCNARLDGSGYMMYGNGNANAVYAAPDAVYIGTYNDTPNRAMTMIPGVFTYESCKQYAIDNKYSLFGLQYFQSGSQTAQCGVSNNYTSSVQYGRANNQTTGNDGYTYGGGWSNSIYAFSGQLGTGPESTYTGCYNDLQPNELMTSLGPGYTYATCQAKSMSIGSKYFALQAYNPTTKTATCLVNDSLSQIASQGTAQTSIKSGSDGKQYGEENINSLYVVGQLGIPENMNKVGYIDENNLLSEYPSNMIDSNGEIMNSPSCTKSISNIDTLQWSGYKTSGAQMTPNTACGLKKAVAQDTSAVDSIREQLVTVADQLIQQITSLESSSIDLTTQMGIDRRTLAQNLELYRSISHEYKHVNMDNINGIVDDSDIRVLQENYSYILWSILAIAIIAILINLIRR